MKLSEMKSRYFDRIAHKSDLELSKNNLDLDLDP